MLDQTAASPNKEAFDENRNLPSTKLDITDAPAIDANPGGPTPTDDASSGIAPIAGFIPKDAPNLSHPTPPPDQPLASGEADVDTEMRDQTAEESKPVDQVASVEVVQPQDESIPAETNPEESLLNGVAKSTEPLPESDSNAEASGDAKPAVASAESTQESAQSGTVRPREDDGDDEPAAKRAKVDEPQPAQKEASAAPTSTPAPATEPKPDAKPAPASTPRAETAAASTEKPAATERQVSSVPSSEPRKREAKYPTTPMTGVQKGYLIDKLKNTKKTKHAIFFLTPVDPVALKIPTYPDVIKHPMDLGTVESKLKNDQYASVQAFADDLQLIVDNAAKFNGPQHAVTHAGNNMLAYTNNFMSKVPGPGVAHTKVTKKEKYSPAPSKPAAPRREARPAPPPPAKERSNTGESFALQADGMPTIRRDSQIQRPPRAIKPPTKHEVTYPKPKRREHLLELKFSEHVLDQIRSPKYAQLNHVFLMPVDPVALNIPHYRQIIKKPMDLGTMTQKLKQGQYGKASELKGDFDLMIENCIAFNPPGNPVRDLGIQLKREFDHLWREKDKWERANKPRSERASSASGDDSAGEESEDEEEPLDEAQATIRALSQKLAEMQNQLAGLGQGKAPKAKKAKEIAKVSSKKKALSSAVSRPPKHVPAAPKSKPKKQKPVTYEEKQEISSAVEKMDGAQIERLTQIITENCEKYRNMGDEMELEIDDLPDDVQRLLLKHVRSIFGNPNRAAREPSPGDDDLAAEEDDDFQPSHRARGGGGGGGDAKRKKHKPMGKKEQQDSINNLRNQLAAFKGGPQPSGSVSPGASHAAAAHGDEDDSSGDDSEESEEE
jgi:bromodomain-containing factor 1